MNPIISIIVPVYNVQSYLPRCINSILDQTFSDFELLLINDGSTDNSGNICDEYSKKDSRIIVIHKENGGVSSARNVGIDAAKGEYLAFIDSDDFIHQKMYEILYQIASNYSSDVVVCDFLKVQNENVSLHNAGYNIKHFTNIQALNELYTNNYKNAQKWVFLWNKLYKRNLFNDVKFPDGKIYEDELVAHKILYSCQILTYIDMPFYYYLQRSGSYIGSKFSRKKFDRIYALIDRVNYFKMINQQSLHDKALKHFIDVFFWYYAKAKFELHGINKDLKNLKRILNQNLINILKNPLIGWKQKVFITLFVINPSIYQINKNNL
ncbi:glycosyltransferase family 2 protein [Lederbergia panacisoli]|uniref:glycosyltransferase family 2 protein n=1 Tax=Lederbergia panacisoli TaxID=1255251 RepID=UPI00214CB47B|nr:glycosyltransferase [Lederbergia panacisoli]MCR2822025.1 glycosyltransferase [Lederbergia panacisoli]